MRTILSDLVSVAFAALVIILCVGVVWGAVRSARNEPLIPWKMPWKKDPPAEDEPFVLTPEHIKAINANPGASLNMVIEVSKDALKTQDAQVEALDRKANFVLGSSSLLTAGITLRTNLSSSAGKLVIHGPITLHSVLIVGLIG